MTARTLLLLISLVAITGCSASGTAKEEQKSTTSHLEGSEEEAAEASVPEEEPAVEEVALEEAAAPVDEEAASAAEAETWYCRAQCQEVANAANRQDTEYTAAS